MRKVFAILAALTASIFVASPVAAAPSTEAKTLHASYVAQAAADIASFNQRGVPEAKRPTITTPSLLDLQLNRKLVCPIDKWCGWTGYQGDGSMYAWTLTALDPDAPCKCGVSGADMGGSFNNISSYLNRTTQTIYVYDDEIGFCDFQANEGWASIPPGGGGSYGEFTTGFNNDISGLLDPDYTGHHPGCL
jgi:hypothetical protein